MKKIKRVYKPGVCQDCGYHKNVTEITFWATGMKYRVCADDIKPYRKIINDPAPKTKHSAA